MISLRVSTKCINIKPDWRVTFHTIGKKQGKLTFVFSVLKSNSNDDSLKSKSRACFKNVLKELISQTTNRYIDTLFIFSFLLIISFLVVCVSVRVKGNRVPLFFLLA